MTPPASDIFAGQASSADDLAALYDLEHDELTEDLVFYRELARRSHGTVLDLGCGSGRLFDVLLGERRRLVGVDGSPALLARARARIARSERLSAAARAGRLALIEADVAAVGALTGRYGLVIVAGVLPHLDGPRATAALLAALHRRLAERGSVVIDILGPGGLPDRDLAMNIDWERTVDGVRVVRRSSLVRVPAADGLRLRYSTIVDRVHPDGTIARLPASFGLWYPYPAQLMELLEGAGLCVESAHGSHDLDPLDGESERCIVVARR